MFKGFSRSSFGSQSAPRSSVIKDIRSRLCELYPRIEPFIDDIVPKPKEANSEKPVVIVKAKGKTGDTRMLLVSNQIVCFELKTDIWVPHLRVLHKYPGIMKRCQVDAGGTPFVVKGANLMAPGLISAGGAMEDFDESEVLQVVGENSDIACAICFAIKSSSSIRSEGTGVALENVHCISDGLYSAFDQST